MLRVRVREAVTFGALFGVACVTILAECVRDGSLFALHPAMNAIACLVCTPAALFVMLERKRVAKRETRVLMTKLHFGLQVLAMVLMAIGGIAIFLVKKAYGKPHATSVHSWTAITTVLFFLLNILQGLLLTFEKTPTNWQWRDETHGLVGTLVYIGSAVTMVYGLHSGNWGLAHFGSDRQLHLSILIGLAHVVLLGKAIVASRPRSRATKTKDA